MLLREVGGPRRRVGMSQEAVIVGMRWWWGHGSARGQFALEETTTDIVGSNRRPGWRNYLKLVAGVGAHGGLRPGGEIVVARGRV
jgi:hypothetical protein